MIDQDVILSQLHNGQNPNGAVVYHPKKISFWFFLTFIPLGVAWLFACTAFYGAVIIAFGGERMIESSFWPIYIHYPFLILPQVLIPLLFPYLVWRIEKRNRDVVLVLLPEGFIRYKPWTSAKNCQVKAIEYINIKKMSRKIKPTGIALDISYNDGTCEVVFLTTKLKASLTIREQIISNYFSFTKNHQVSTEN